MGGFNDISDSEKAMYQDVNNQRSNIIFNNSISERAPSSFSGQMLVSDPNTGSMPDSKPETGAGFPAGTYSPGQSTHIKRINKMSDAEFKEFLRLGRDPRGPEYPSKPFEGEEEYDRNWGLTDRERIARQAEEIGIDEIDPSTLLWQTNPEGTKFLRPLTPIPEPAPAPAPEQSSQYPEPPEPPVFPNPDDHVSTTTTTTTTSPPPPPPPPPSTALEQNNITGFGQHVRNLFGLSRAANQGGKEGEGDGEAPVTGEGIKPGEINTVDTSIIKSFVHGTDPSIEAAVEKEFGGVDDPYRPGQVKVTGTKLIKEGLESIPGLQGTITRAMLGNIGIGDPTYVPAEGVIKVPLNRGPEATRLSVPSTRPGRPPTNTGKEVGPYNVPLTPHQIKTLQTHGAGTMPTEITIGGGIDDSTTDQGGNPLLETGPGAPVALSVSSEDDPLQHKPIHIEILPGVVASETGQEVVAGISTLEAAGQEGQRLIATGESIIKRGEEKSGRSGEAFREFVGGDMIDLYNILTVVEEQQQEPRWRGILKHITTDQNVYDAVSAAVEAGAKAGVKSFADPIKNIGNMVGEEFTNVGSSAVNTVAEETGNVLTMNLMNDPTSMWYHVGLMSIFGVDAITPSENARNTVLGEVKSTWNTQQGMNTETPTVKALAAGVKNMAPLEDAHIAAMKAAAESAGMSFQKYMASEEGQKNFKRLFISLTTDKMMGGIDQLGGWLAQETGQILETLGSKSGEASQGLLNRSEEIGGQMASNLNENFPNGNFSYVPGEYNNGEFTGGYVTGDPVNLTIQYTTPSGKPYMRNNNPLGK